MTAGGSPTLLGVASHGLKGTLRELPSEPLQDDAWAEMLAEIRRERLSGLLLAVIEAVGLHVTEAQRREATDLHIAATTHVLMLENFLINTVELLAEAGVRCRVLKGSAVAHLDYADPSYRTFADIDLLVESDAFDTASQTLIKAGHHRYHPQIHPGYDRRFGKGVSFVSGAGLEVDLHRTLVLGPYGLALDLDDLWSTSQEFSLAGTTFSALGPDERLLHACYHAALGNWPPRLQPHRDVAEQLLYGRCDEDRVLKLSRKWRGEAVLARAISTAWNLFDIADVTALSAWASRYHVDGPDRSRLAMYSDGNTSYAAKSLASLAVLPNMRDRLAFVRMVAGANARLQSRAGSSRPAWLLESLRRATRRSEGSAR